MYKSLQLQDFFFLDNFSYICCNDFDFFSKKDREAHVALSIEGNVLKAVLNIEYWASHILAQIYTENHATFPMQIDEMTVQICGNFWGT